MPTIRLTQVAIEKLKPPAEGREVHWDRTLPGFGLRLTANGARSWIAKYRVNGKAVMETIAPVTRMPRVDEARALARASMQKAQAGENPVAEKRADTARIAQNTIGSAAKRY